MNIRPFRYTDIDALIEIAQVSFAEEYTLRGGTPDSFINQIRMITRGRMIPFKLLSALAGIQWELLVAEADGRVVGCGAYLGRKQMELTNLMVHPDYRRRGIGQALLVKRLQLLAEKGYPLATTTILASNQASLGNVTKQGFTAFDRYTLFEIPLPLQQNLDSEARQLTSRPIQKSDAAAFQAIEKKVTNLVRLEIYGSAITGYIPSLGDMLLNRLSNAHQWTQTFSTDREIVGFLRANTSTSQTTGVLSRPLITDEHLDYLPAMLQDAANWLAHQGKTVMQINVADEHERLIAYLEHMGWVKTHSWVQLVKRLDKLIETRVA